MMTFPKHEEPLDIILANWYVPENGFKWDDKAEPVQSRPRFGKAPFLVEQVMGDKKSFYDPQQMDPPLFVRFVELDGARDSIL